jgi:hypothetical protein
LRTIQSLEFSAIIAPKIEHLTALILLRHRSMPLYGRSAQSFALKTEFNG